jgi:hypothetical protein
MLLWLWACGQRFFSVVHMSTASVCDLVRRRG